MNVYGPMGQARIWERKRAVIYSFSGGLRVKRPKLPSLMETPILSDAVTRRIPLAQTLSVKVGDTVGRGGLLATATEREAACFSGISGTVTAIEPTETATLVTVTRDGSVPDAAPLPPVEGKLSQMTAETLSRLLRERGVTPPTVGEIPIRHLIVDCSGDDPYNASRDALCTAHAGKVLGGLKILMKLLSVTDGVLAVANERWRLANEFQTFLPRRSKLLRVETVRGRYPQAEPRLLVSALFRTEIHPSLSVEQAGYTVVSPMLCHAVFDALGGGIPYTDAIVTLAEESLSYIDTQVLTVPLGTRVEELATRLRRPAKDGMRLTVGGGYRARDVEDGETVTADTEAVTRFKPYHTLKKRLGVCIGCGACGDVCPMMLMPSLLYEAVTADLERAANNLDITACIGCGSCTASCPAGLPLKETFAAYLTETTGDASHEG